MAKPPAKQSPMPARRPGGMGQRPGARPYSAARRRAVSTMMNLVLLAILIALAMLAFPTFLLVCFGMLPSLVAYVVDKTPRWSLTFSVAPPNMAATAIFITKLWMGDSNTTDAVFSMMGNPYAWCVLYLSAGAGWMVYFGMPILVTGFKEYTLDRQREGFFNSAKALREEWGPDIGPDDLAIEETAALEVKAVPEAKPASALPPAATPAAAAPKKPSSPAASVVPAQPV